MVVKIRLGLGSRSELICCVITGKSLPLSGPWVFSQSNKEAKLDQKLQTGRLPADSDLRKWVPYFF